MNTRDVRRLAVLLSLSLMASASHADGIPVTVGAKAWFTNWTSWVARFDASNREVLVPVSGDTKVATTPVIALQFGDALVSASYMPKTDYSLTGAGQRSRAARTELDFNAGYFLVPGLAATIGYKQITQTFASLDYRWRGPTFSLGGSVPAGRGVGLYGTAGFGFMKVSLPVPDSGGQDSLDARYSLAEFGVTYAFGRVGGVVDLSFTGGYRAQSVRTAGLVLQAPNAGTYRDNARDFTHGLTLTVIGTF